jgi:hypothetical protein
VNFKRWLRHPNTLKQCFGMLVLSSAICLFVSNDLVKLLGFVLAGSSVLMLVFAAAELDHLFWKSELEWWDDADARFEDWQRGI